MYNVEQNYGEFLLLGLDFKEKSNEPLVVGM
jgi:hypothetical protein